MALLVSSLALTSLGARSGLSTPSMRLHADVHVLL